MSSSIHRLALFLNQYANLLLVIVTTFYVGLTWRSLVALRRASLREREARHLADMKENVIQPIVWWIRQTLLGRFTGRTPQLLALSGGYDGKPLQLCHQVDSPFVARHRLPTPQDPDVPDPLATWTSTESNRVEKFLYEHAKRDHFQRELPEFDRLLEGAVNLTGAIISFANDCARNIASQDIPEAVNLIDQNSMPEWTNPHLLAAECIHSLLRGDKEAKIVTRNDQGFTLTNLQNQTLAKAMRADTLERWRNQGFLHVRSGWEAGDMPRKVARLLEDADRVSRRIDQLRFTHTLRQDCEFVSGKRR